jgi:hypothetical protein
MNRTPRDFVNRLRNHVSACESEFCMCKLILKDFELSYGLEVTE